MKGRKETAPRDLSPDAASALLRRLRERSQGPARARETPKDRGKGRVRGQSNRDPQRLATVVDTLITENGWGTRLAGGTVFAQWPELVGKEIAARSRPVSFHDGRLSLRCDSPIWASQLRLLAPQIVRQCQRHVGADLVTHVDILMPTTTRQGARAPRRLQLPGGKGGADVPFSAS